MRKASSATLCLEIFITTCSLCLHRRLPCPDEWLARRNPIHPLTPLSPLPSLPAYLNNNTYAEEMQTGHEVGVGGGVVTPMSSRGLDLRVTSTRDPNIPWCWGWMVVMVTALGENGADDCKFVAARRQRLSSRGIFKPPRPKITQTTDNKSIW